MQHIKKGDTVKVISGNHKGKEGRLLKILTEKNRVIVEKVNLQKKHTKPSKKNQTGGIVEIEGSINISNIKLVCPRCNAATRVSIIEADGKRIRKCKECNEIIDK